MGFFDIFKKNDSGIRQEDINELSKVIAKSFEKARECDENLSKKLDYLYVKHEGLQGKHDKNLTLLFSWFEYFQKMHEEHKKEIETLKKRLEEVNEKLEVVEKIDEEFIKNVVDNYVSMPKDDKLELEEELVEELTFAREDTVDIEKTTKRLHKTLTKSELELLNVLYSSHIPLSYIDLAQKVKKSPNTVKVYLNVLKNKGIELEEHSALRGIKLHSISNKEKIKKFYNLG